MRVCNAVLAQEKFRTILGLKEEAPIIEILRQGSFTGEEYKIPRVNSRNFFYSNEFLKNQKEQKESKI